MKVTGKATALFTVIIGMHLDIRGGYHLSSSSCCSQKNSYWISEMFYNNANQTSSNRSRVILPVRQ